MSDSRLLAPSGEPSGHDSPSPSNTPGHGRGHAQSLQYGTTPVATTAASSAAPTTTTAAAPTTARGGRGRGRGGRGGGGAAAPQRPATAAVAGTGAPGGGRGGRGRGGRGGGGADRGLQGPGRQNVDVKVSASDRFRALIRSVFGPDLIGQVLAFGKYFIFYRWWSRPFLLAIIPAYLLLLGYWSSDHCPAWAAFVLAALPALCLDILFEPVMEHLLSFIKLRSLKRLLTHMFESPAHSVLFGVALKRTNADALLKYFVVGSVFCNVLFVTGGALIVAGFGSTSFDVPERAAKAFGTMLLVASVFFVLPTLFSSHAGVVGKETGDESSRIRTASHITAIFMMALYIGFALFQSRTHKHVFADTEAADDAEKNEKQERKKTRKEKKKLRLAQERKATLEAGMTDERDVSAVGVVNADPHHTNNSSPSCSSSSSSSSSSCGHSEEMNHGGASFAVVAVEKDPNGPADARANSANATMNSNGNGHRPIPAKCSERVSKSLANLQTCEQAILGSPDELTSSRRPTPHDDINDHAAPHNEHGGHGGHEVDPLEVGEHMIHPVHPWLLFPAVLLMATVIENLCDMMLEKMPEVAEELSIPWQFIASVPVVLATSSRMMTDTWLAARIGRVRVSIKRTMSTSIQLLLMLFPFFVIISWINGAPLQMRLPVMLAGALILSVLVSNNVLGKAEASWLEGAVLVTLYAVIATYLGVSEETFLDNF